jgi:hypothetical protein
LFNQTHRIKKLLKAAMAQRRMENKSTRLSVRYDRKFPTKRQGVNVRMFPLPCDMTA